MNNEIKTFVGMFGVALLVTILSIVLSNGAYDSGYRQGQIDALTGKVTVELVTNADSTKSWKDKASLLRGYEWRTLSK
jgi:hypothetical protein